MTVLPTPHGPASSPRKTATVRPATEADAPALADVFLAAWRSGYRGVVPDDVIEGLDAAELTATLARRLHTVGQHTVAAVDDRDRPIGFAGYGADDEHPGGGYLASLYVHPSAGRAGVGRRLLRHALDEMSDVDVRLWVFEGNAAARRLYEREGFRPDGGRLTDARWRTPQIRYRRPARNRARPLPPVPDILVAAPTSCAAEDLVAAPTSCAAEDLVAAPTSCAAEDPDWWAA
jgi:ribosomal protein S18 acetylase RimI-like enzyme